MNKKVPFVLGAVTISLVVGGIFGYQYAKNELQEQYDIRVEEEMEKLRQSYSRRYKRDEFETVEKAAEALGVTERIPSGTGRRSGTDIPEGPSFEHSPATNEQLQDIVRKLKYDVSPEEPWVAESSAQEPNPERSGPTIISIEEFVANTIEHYQPTWHYYVVDDVLMDEGGNVVEDRDDIIGKGTLKCFGQGSNDIDLVYVRNTDLERDYEIERVHKSSSDRETEASETDDEKVSSGKRRHQNRSRG